MITVTVTVTATAAGHTVVVNAPRTSGEAETVAEDKGPSPIAPELKELAWGGGSFIVLFVVMRYVLFPRLKKGMDARYGKVRGDHESAEAIRADAKAELAAYEAELAAIKAEARQRIDAARQTLEAERAASLAETNARGAGRRAEAIAAAETAREAATPQIIAAVADVSSRVSELAIGRRPDPATVTNAVSALMAGGVK
ncbi:MAG: ATP synthase F0 subunit B [Ilumatobacteraceae bacterium]